MSRNPARPKAASATLDLLAAATQKALPEPRVLGHGQRRLDRVEVTHVVAELADAGLGRGTLHPDPTGARRQEPAMTRSSVVLPAPFGPRRIRLEPASIVQDSSAKIGRLSRSTDSCRRSVS
jgi:hypothetical protein